MGIVSLEQYLSAIGIVAYFESLINKEACKCECGEVFNHLENLHKEVNYRWGESLYYSKCPKCGKEYLASVREENE